MLDEIKKIKFYAAAVFVALLLFTWAGFSGTRVFGDDVNSVESNRGYYGHSGSTGGRVYNRLHHK